MATGASVGGTEPVCSDLRVSERWVCSHSAFSSKRYEYKIAGYLHPPASAGSVTVLACDSATSLPAPGSVTCSGGGGALIVGTENGWILRASQLSAVPRPAPAHINGAGPAPPPPKTRVSCRWDAWFAPKLPNGEGAVAAIAVLDDGRVVCVSLILASSLLRRGS